MSDGETKEEAKGHHHTFLSHPWVWHVSHKLMRCARPSFNRVITIIKYLRCKYM